MQPRRAVYNAADPPAARGGLCPHSYVTPGGCMGPIEKEFDPSKHTAEYVAVERDDSMASITQKVSDALKRTPYVILIVPRGAHAFHSTQDFLALGKLQWAEEVRVAL